MEMTSRRSFFSRLIGVALAAPLVLKAALMPKPKNLIVLRGGVTRRMWICTDQAYRDQMEEIMADPAFNCFGAKINALTPAELEELYKPRHGDEKFGHKFETKILRTFL